MYTIKDLVDELLVKVAEAITKRYQIEVTLRLKEIKDANGRVDTIILSIIMPKLNEQYPLIEMGNITSFDDEDIYYPLIFQLSFNTLHHFANNLMNDVDKVPLQAEVSAQTGTSDDKLQKAIDDIAAKLKSNKHLPSC